jgi:hypothetical protein
MPVSLKRQVIGLKSFKHNRLTLHQTGFIAITERLFLSFLSEVTIIPNYHKRKTPKNIRVMRAKMMATERVKSIATNAPFLPISLQSAAIVARQGM